jgi:hypothetical protein
MMIENGIAKGTAMAQAQENQLIKSGRIGTLRTLGEHSRFCSDVLAALTLTASMLKQELTSEQNVIWIELLQPYPLPLIQKAFLLHMKASNFLPTPHEIVELIEAQLREERERLEQKRKQREKAELQAARERGETFGFADVLRKFKNVLSSATHQALKEGKKMPSAPIARVRDEAVPIITAERRERLRQQALEMQRRYSANPSARRTDSRQA